GSPLPPAPWRGAGPARPAGRPPFLRVVVRAPALPAPERCAVERPERDAGRVVLRVPVDFFTGLEVLDFPAMLLRLVAHAPRYPSATRGAMHRTPVRTPFHQRTGPWMASGLADGDHVGHDHRAATVLLRHPAAHDTAHRLRDAVG